MLIHLPVDLAAFMLQRQNSVEQLQQTLSGLQSLTYLLSGPWQRKFPTLAFEARGSSLYHSVHPKQLSSSTTRQVTLPRVLKYTHDWKLDGTTANISDQMKF